MLAPIVHAPIDVAGSTVPHPAPPPPMPMPAPIIQSSAPACWQCGGPGTWHSQQASWGCDRCRHMLPPPIQYYVPPQASMNTSSPFVSTLVQIIVVIVAIILIVAIKAGMR